MNIQRTTQAAVCLAALLAAHGTRSQVIINEIGAANLDQFSDSYGEFEDWIELYNTSAAVVDISGWYLSDNPNVPLKWSFGPGTTVPANGRLMVFASSRDQSAGALQHTSFKLNQTDQEWVVLSDAGGTLVDDFQLQDPLQVNASWGRTTDGAATWSVFGTATPNAANAGGGPYYTARPVLVPDGGYHAAGVNVTMSSPVAGSTIRYTLDGSTPTAASTAYSGPITLNNTTVVRAMAFDPDPNVPPSFVETNTYFINVTHAVPIISGAGDQLLDLLNGNGSIRPLCHLEYYGPDGVLRDEAFGEYNEHGQDSWAYDQRGVDFVARDQTGYNDGIHYPMFRTKSRDHYQRFIIKAAAGDNYNFGPGQPAHIRDAYVQALSQIGDLRLDERSYEPCVFYVNGQYWGVYDVREKVDDTDFTSYYYDQDEYDLQFLKTWGGTWAEYGGPQAIADWNALLNYINTNNMGDPTAFNYVDSLFNWKSLIDYFCINSYTVCSDWLNWNTGWWRGRNPNGDKKKWRYILWDMDATFDHYANFTGIPDQSVNADPCNSENLPDPGGQGHTQILTKLMNENQQVRDFYVNRYIDLGNTLFSCNTMVPFLDSLIANIAPEMPGQVARWGGSVADWQANVQLMRDFIEQRCITIQQGLVDCYDVSGPHEVVFDVDPPLSGAIEINSITPSAYPFTGLYYGGITTNLTALPESGWTFGFWTIDNDTILPSLTDSAAWLTIDTTCTIIAHFVPPITHQVMLDVDPPGSAAIQLGGDLYTTFPTWVEVPEGISMPLQVLPAPYRYFLYWDILNNTTVPADSTLPAVDVAFFSTDTVVAHLEQEIYGYYVPNSFTPNADGINDVWLPLGNAFDVLRFQLQVFDRWGELVHETNDPFEGWDGQANGKDAPDGVYVFRVNVVDAIDNEDHELTGHVTLLR
ncbi:MAG TPA: CotH kinase family protein [Flavobacteriales bacterium]|nr:CotH kinase family protein [Flavobacteriales bacterium]